MKEPNIFDNIVKNEDTLTYLLVNMLRMKKFREIFFKVIGINLNEIKIDYNDITAQYKTVENGKPDIVIENDDVLFFIEIKISKLTSFTKNQPIGYLKELYGDKRKNKGLVLLVPRGYKLDMYKEKVNIYKEGVGRKKGGDLFTKEIVWKLIIDQIENHELQLWNPIMSEFHKLLKNWFLAPPVILNVKNIKTMFSSDTPTAIRRIIEIVDEVINELSRNSVEVHKMKYITDEYGGYITIENLKDMPFFFGEWFLYWEDSGNPLCLCIKSEKSAIIDAFKNKCNDLNLPEPNPFKDWLVTYFPKKEIEIKDEKLVEKITEKITKIIAEMNSVTS